MASNYTEHYGLCQWAPEDKFLREEFNGDNRAIDAALSRASQGADHALAVLAPMSDNVLGLMMQRYYEGKSISWKKALLCGGFLNREEMAQRSPSVLWQAGRVWLDSGGQRDYHTGKTSGAGCTVGLGGYHERQWVPTGHGTVNAITVYIRSQSNFGSLLSGTGKIEVLRDGKTIATTSVEEVAQNFVGNTFSVSFPVVPEQVYTLRYWAVSVQGADLSRHDLLGDPDRPGAFAFGVQCTPTPQSTGYVEGRAEDMGQAWTGAQGWVRSSGTAPSLLLQGPEGTWLPMERGDAVSTKTLQGVSCVETAFTLRAQGAARTAVRLELNRAATVYEYAVALF